MTLRSDSKSLTRTTLADKWLRVTGEMKLLSSGDHASNRSLRHFDIELLSCRRSDGHDVFATHGVPLEFAGIANTDVDGIWNCSITQYETKNVPLL